MANFSTSNLLTAQTIVSDKYKKPEMRMKPAPAFGLLSSNDNFLVVGAETLKTRDDRAIEAHLLSRTKRNSGSARAYNHTGTFDDSQKVTLSWTTKTDKFAISLKLLDKSVFDFNTVLANKLEQACMNILEDKETEAIAYLRAQRTAVSSTPSGAVKRATYNSTNTSFEVDATNKSQFYQIVSSILKQHKYSSALDVVADSSLYIDAEYIAAQGSSNSANLAFQFQNKTIVESIELNDSNYDKGVVIAMPKQSVCVLNWIPKQNRNGWGDFNSYVGGFSTFEYLGYTFALHGYASRTDTSSSNGDTQDVTLEFELSLDSSYNKAPLTTANETVIYQIAQTA
jgi:hypothetical protein